mgnify:CR=1 FL=1
MLPNWMFVVAAVELISVLIFWLCIATAVPEGTSWLTQQPNRKAE